MIRTALLGVLLLGCTPAGGEYYVSPTGDDAGPGTSPASAWKTVERVNAAALGPGDRVYLQSGRTFPGPLKFGPDDRGAIITSSGPEPAVIDGGVGHAIVVEGSSGLVFRNLKLLGAGRGTGSRQGVGLLLSGASKCAVEDLDAGGFQRAGVEIRGCAGLVLTRVHAHDNGFAGICSDGPGSKDLTIAHCRAINNPGDPTILKNHSGNGIVLYHAERSVIEYCEAAENGWDMPRKGNGPVGIWCADSDRITIQFCVSHHNQSPGADGGGFDFDGGVTRSVMQYNFSHSNKGWGYLLYDYGSERPWRDNVVRFNVSENDGDAGIGVGESETRGFSDAQIYGNTVYNDRGSPAVRIFEGTPKKFTFRNNLFVSKGPQVEHAEKARFEGNGYWTPGGGFQVDEFRTLEEWVGKTAQEKVGDKVVGMNVDPRLTGPFAGNPQAYRLAPDSPVKGKGLDLKALFGIDPGVRDFYGPITSAPTTPGAHQPR